MFCDTIGRLFLNLRTVFFTSFHFVSGLSSKVHCFNIVMLGASSLSLMKVSVLCFKFLVNRIFFEPKNKMISINDEKLLHFNLLSKFGIVSPLLIMPLSTQQSKTYLKMFNSLFQTIGGANNNNKNIKIEIL